MTTSTASRYKKLAANRRALHDYSVEDRLEAGVELRGTEVKSIREGHVSLVGSYVRIERGEAFVYGMNVAGYDHGNRFNHIPERPRRLLLHRREILGLQSQTDRKGATLIPLSVYLKKGRVKLEVGICRGRQKSDKREVLKRKDATREADRAMAAARRR